MKKFPYKFTPLIKCFFAIGLLMALGVIAVNVIHFSKTETPGTYNYITLVSTLLVAVLTIVIGISVIFASYFMIDDENLTLRWGFLSQKIKIVSITKLVKLEKSDKLIVNFNGNNFMVVFISSKYFSDFSATLVSKNKNIVVEYTAD